jgi:hypothetical protein
MWIRFHVTIFSIPVRVLHTAGFWTGSSGLHYFSALPTGIPNEPTHDLGVHRVFSARLEDIHYDYFQPPQ